MHDQCCHCYCYCSACCTSHQSPCLFSRALLVQTALSRMKFHVWLRLYKSFLKLVHFEMDACLNSPASFEPFVLKRTSISVCTLDLIQRIGELSLLNDITSPPAALARRRYADSIVQLSLVQQKKTPCFLLKLEEQDGSARHTRCRVHKRVCRARATLPSILLERSWLSARSSFD